MSTVRHMEYDNRTAQVLNSLFTTEIYGSGNSKEVIRTEWIGSYTS